MKVVALSALLPFLCLSPAFSQTFDSLSYNTLWGLNGVQAEGSGDSVARWISPDGKTVVGYAYDENRVTRAVRWTSVGGISDLGTLRSDNAGSGLANGVSLNGSVIAGGATDNTNTTKAFRWTEAGGMQNLGTLRANNTGSSTAYAVNADGSVIAGISANDISSDYHAFRWTAAGGMQDLGTLRADNSGWSEALAVSADGTVIAGFSQYQAGNAAYHAFRWTAADGMQRLDNLRDDQLGYGTANGISADNRFVVGGAMNNEGEMRAVIWDETGTARDLGTLRADNAGRSYGRGVNADGTVVVGVAESDVIPDLGRAFIWTEADGMEDLGTLRADNSGRSEAYSVSADGKTVTGWTMADEGFRAFIYKHRRMQDFDNLHQSFPVLGAQKERAATYQQQSMDHLLATRCSVRKEGENCFKIEGYYNYAASSSSYDFGQYQQALGVLTLGRGLDDQWTIGTNLSVSSDQAKHSSVDLKAGFATNIWTAYSQSGIAGSGLQLDASAGYYRQRATITRGRYLDNVEAVSGQTRLNTLGARLGVGYGFKLQEDWLITPQAALTYQTTAFDAYQETGGAMNAGYNKSTLRTAEINLGATAQYAISDMSGISFGTGVRRDLDIKNMNLSGTSDIPYIEKFNIKNPLHRNKLRPYLSIGYTFSTIDSGIISTNIGMIKDPFFKSINFNATASYSIIF